MPLMEHEIRALLKKCGSSLSPLQHDKNAESIRAVATTFAMNYHPKKVRKEDHKHLLGASYGILDTLEQELGVDLTDSDVVGAIARVILAAYNMGRRREQGKIDPDGNVRPTKRAIETRLRLEAKPPGIFVG